MVKHHDRTWETELCPTHITEWSLWGKQEEAEVLGTFAIKIIRDKLKSKWIIEPSNLQTPT